MRLPQLWRNFGIIFIALSLSFKIISFQFHMISWFVIFDLHVWKQKSDITWAPYEHFYLLKRSCVCVPQLWHNFGNFFIVLSLDCYVLTFQFHMIATFVIFDLHVWTQKSDITRGTYENFHLLARSCVCFPQFWHNFSIFFIALPLSFIILIFQSYIIACSVIFESHVWTQKSDIIRAT